MNYFILGIIIFNCDYFLFFLEKGELCIEIVYELKDFKR